MKPNELIAKIENGELDKSFKRFMSVTVQLKNKSHVI